MPVDKFSHARSMTREAADMLAEVAAGKERAAKLDPGRDVSAENAKRAKAERWSKTDWKGWPLPSVTTHG